MDQQRAAVNAVPKMTEVGRVVSTVSGTVAVLPRKPKLATDPQTRTAEAGAVVHDEGLVRGQDPTGGAAEAIHSGVVTKRETIRVVIGAADDGAGPAVNLPIIPRVVILRALDRGHVRADRCPVPPHDFPRTRETHLAPSIDALPMSRQNARSCTSDVWRQR